VSLALPRGLKTLLHAASRKCDISVHISEIPC
jgi:hypothetical protein